MTFDTPEHKELCNQIIEQASFSGRIIEIALQFKEAVKNAKVSDSSSDLTILKP